MTSLDSPSRRPSTVDPPATRASAGAMAALFDPGSFTTITAEDDSGMLAGAGRIDGAHVVAFCSDPTVQGGAMGTAGCKVILAAYARALADDVPIVGLWHSGGARLREGVASLHAVGEVFAIMTRASGVIPQISVVLGAAAGGAAYGPALTDIVILGPEGRVFVTGPDVVRSVTGEDVDMERLGGPEPHGRRQRRRPHHRPTPSARRSTRPAARVAARPPGRVRRGRGRRPRRACCPSRPSGPTTCTRSSSGLLDEGTGLELHARWAPNITTTLGRLGGRTVGVIANNPLRLGGCLDSASAEKAARFVRMCDAFGVPLVVLVDVPGYLPGVGQEWDGVVRRGAKLLHAFAECVVPAGHRRHAQGVRRRLHRDELPRARCDPGLRLAGRARRRHGFGRRRPRPAPSPARRGPRRPARRSSSRSSPTSTS